MSSHGNQRNPRPATAIVFVNYHSEALIAPRAAALASAGFHVCVADNSGTYVDETSRVVRLGRNVGYGYGVNAALRDLPRGIRNVVLHNPDVDCETAAILNLVGALSHQGHPGAAAPALLTPGGLRTRGFAYPHPIRELFLTWRGTRPVSGRAALRARQLNWPFGRRFASAALLVVDRSALDAIGGFDERYFLYGEDLDLWHRLRVAGREVAFVPDVVAHHAAATGSPMSAPRRELLRQLGTELYFETFSPRWLPVVRWIHRRFLRALATNTGDLATSVERLWHAGAAPSDVALGLRPLLEDSQP